MSTIAALASFAIGSIVFLGWMFDVEPMRRAFMGSIHMLPNTSLAFMAGAAALWLQRHPGTRLNPRRRVGIALGAVVFVIGLLTWIERMFLLDFGIDRLLFVELLGQHPYRPLGRMATNSALALLLAGAALLSLDRRTASGRRPANWFATLGVGIATMAIVGHLYNAQALYRFDAAAAMALCTAIAMLALHFGILSARSATNGIALLISETAGGMLARRMVLAVSIVPLVLGWMVIKVREANLMSREAAISVFVVLVIAILIAIALRVSARIQFGDLARQAMFDRASKAREEAERANRAKDDFLAVMSHELRTPLNAIIGYGSLMSAGIPDPVSAGQQQQLARIGASANHLLALIDEVLTLSRLSTGAEVLVPEPVSLATICDEAAAMVQPQARAKGLVFDVQLPEHDLVVDTDRGKLCQALVNLLGNAVKFTDHGRVSLRVESTTADEQVTIIVDDTGPGIAPAHLDRVFESFWQVDQGPSRRTGGVGLGLHVTRQLVTILGGVVTATSTIGEGSRFAITLPRRRSETEPGEEQKKFSSSSL